MERDGKRVLWLKDTNSHGEIMEHYELSDGKLVDRDHVKYEIAPTDIFSAERDDWSLRLDEARTLPEWYAEDTLAADAAVWAEWSNMVKELHAALGALDLGRRDAMVERVKALRPGDRTISRSAVRAAVSEHVRRLTARDAHHRAIAVSDVRFYTQSEWASIWDSVIASVWASVWDSVWTSVRASVIASVWDSVWASVWDSVWTSVRDSVWTSVRDSVIASVWTSVRASVWDSVWDSVWTSVWASVWASVVSDDEDNHGVPLIEILEHGCVLYGVDMDGVAHVVMLGQDGDL